MLSKGSLSVKFNCFGKLPEIREEQPLQAIETF